MINTRQIISLLFWILSLILALFTTKIYRWFKFLIWSNSLDLIEFTLEPIYQKAGIVVIEGGAETGKTLLAVLFLKYLKGKKWTNLETLIPGIEKLTLEVCKEHRNGVFKGQIGKNHCLFIDRSWDFFSNRSITTKELANLLYFFSETSTHKYKFFLVSNPKGNKVLNNFIAHRSATIKTLGITEYVEWWNEKFYYLKILFNDHQISIPFTKSDFNLFDPKASLDLKYSKNRLISIVDQLNYDKLVEMLGHRKSKAENAKEAAQWEAFGRKNFPSLYLKNDCRRFWRYKEKHDGKRAKPITDSKENEESITEKVAVLSAQEIHQLADQKYPRNTPEWELELDRLTAQNIESQEKGEEENV